MKNVLQVLLLIALLSPTVVKAQVITNDRTREKLFLREVKVIDEFIERFNDDPNSFLRQEYKNAHQPFPFTRLDMINTLFNYHTDWKKDDAKSKFMVQVVDTAGPQKLYFNKTGWYAETQCVFNYNKHEVKVTLVLQVKAEGDKSTKWMIAKVGQAPAFDGYAQTPVAAEAASTKGRYFISPSSCATNFLELHQVLNSEMNAANFFTPEALNATATQKLVGLIRNKSVTFNRVENVKFHFYQIPNYIFVVEQFLRSESNSGWLINSLTALTETEKETKRSELLR